MEYHIVLKVIKNRRTVRKYIPKIVMLSKSLYYHFYDYK